MQINFDIIIPYFNEEKTAIQTLKPQAVIVPRVQTDFHDIFDYKEKYKFKLYFIPVEHSITPFLVLRALEQI